MGNFVCLYVSNLSTNYTYNNEHIFTGLVNRNYNKYSILWNSQEAIYQIKTLLQSPDLQHHFENIPTSCDLGIFFADIL